MSLPERPTHGLRFTETAFYVVHRRREYGPFDYDWTPDLRGVELTYCGRKYGEVLSPHQMSVDLSPFRLPRKVMQVAVLITGGLLCSIRQGDSPEQRRRRLTAVLAQFGCERFAAEIVDSSAE